ncbi:MAG: DNA-3-methyladenine glycosylase [Bacteroidota bacterium]
MKPLPRSFYLRPTVQVAKDLLGKFIVRKLKSKTLIGKIVETEAYCEGDPASHSYRGKTKRNDVMFWQGGHLYVYFTYGMHFCANVVTREEGIGEAVLIRAVEPMEGIDVMMRNKQRRGGAGAKGRSKTSPLRRRSPAPLLTNGPAKFCQAFGIGRKENGTDLLGDKVFIANGERIPASKIGRSTRIGIRNGKEMKWRFFVKGSRWVSRPWR